MGERETRRRSRRATPWDGKQDLTPTQLFISDNFKAHYEQRHPLLQDTGEVDMINSYKPVQCPFCGGIQFQRYGHSRIGVQRYKCLSPECRRTFLPTTGTIFDEHKISISEWIEYCLNIFRHVTISADSWNNKNAFTTSRYWLEKLFLLLDGYQDDIILSGRIWLDETYYSIMMKDAEVNEDGTKPRGLSRNKICIGVATNKSQSIIIAEGFGKPSQKMTYDTFVQHITPGSTLVHDKEKTHRKLVEKLQLNSEEYASKDLKRLEDLENIREPPGSCEPYPLPGQTVPVCSWRVHA